MAFSPQHSRQVFLTMPMKIYCAKGTRYQEPFVFSLTGKKTSSKGLFCKGNFRHVCRAFCVRFWTPQNIASIENVSCEIWVPMILPQRTTKRSIMPTSQGNKVLFWREMEGNVPVQITKEKVRLNVLNSPLIQNSIIVVTVELKGLYDHLKCS